MCCSNDGYRVPRFVIDSGGLPIRQPFKFCNFHEWADESFLNELPLHVNYCNQAITLKTPPQGSMSAIRIYRQLSPEDPLV